MVAYDALVLAGGSGQRLGGADKAAIAVGARTLLDRALAAVAGAERVVVVGPDRDILDGVLVVSEQPPGGGPVAAVAAGLARVEADYVMVLACDMPLVTAQTVQHLVGAAEVSADGAILTDQGGRLQLLCAVYRSAALRAAIAQLDAVDGAPMRRVVSRLTLTEISSDAEVTLDCDTWEDVERTRRILEE